MPRRSLTAKQREELYDAECVKARAAMRGDYPICALCDLAIIPGQRWHDNHDKYRPHALGGQRDGISHERCNLEHNHKVDTPYVAKVKRQRQKFIGAWQTRSRPMPGTIRSNIVTPFRGEPYYRDSGDPVFQPRGKA